MTLWAIQARYSLVLHVFGCASNVLCDAIRNFVNCAKSHCEPDPILQSRPKG
jgi:hypothetical protein